MNSLILKVTVPLIVFTFIFQTDVTADERQPKFYTNSIGMKFVRIDPGTFTMGVGETPLPVELTSHRGTQAEGDFDEHPNHTVEITEPFYMAVTEVTNAHYELFDPDHKKLRGKDNGLSTEDDEAVINVNWYDAQAFCRWLSNTEGLPYRLPTEAEWEYACRAGTTTAFHTGDTLPESFRKNARMVGTPEYVRLHVGKISPNAWGLYDMHGNVEEWCYDWYGPYLSGKQKDSVGYSEGDFKVTRGGSFGTVIYYLRSANRMGIMPESKNWLIGFRPVIGKMPETEPLPAAGQPLNQQNVLKRDRAVVSKCPDPDVPYFKGPRKYVRIRKEANGPIFAGHNHSPAIVECPNGDLLAIWYTGIGERERNMAVVASRLVYGTDQWQPASTFWDTPDRNDTGLTLWFDGESTIYHFNAISVSSNWARMAVIMRTSTDSGATWSKPSLILPEFNGNHQLSEPVFRTNDGKIALAVDGPDTLFFSRDEGLTWFNPGGDIAGMHTGVAQLDNGTIIAISRKGYMEGRKMPMSLSTDGGRSFTYRATEFPGIGGGQRPVLLKLREGPLFMASFGNLYGNTQFAPVMITDSAGNKIQAKELFAAVSFDGGKTWPHKRIIGPENSLVAECTDGGAITIGPRSSEHRGYMSVCQGLDNTIHLISSRQHYAFNLKWLTTTPPPAPAEIRVKHEIETFSGPKFDLEEWFDYKSYYGNFKEDGVYTIDSIMAYGGINRVVGAGSFDAVFVLKNIHFNYDYTWHDISIGFKDKLGRTWFLVLGTRGMSMRFKDHEAGEPGDYIDRSQMLMRYYRPPESVKVRFIYNEESGRCRLLYGINGSEPTIEPEMSRKGMCLARPFSESNAAYILISDATADADHFEIIPIE